MEKSLMRTGCSCRRLLKKGVLLMEKNILIYNNNTGVAETMGPLFAGEGIRANVIRRQEELEEVLEQGNIHLLMMDVHQQDNGVMNGVELIAHIRNISSVPIIVVSADAKETSKIMALNAGADDYVTLACNPLEILARVKSQLRRYTQLVNMCANIDRIYRVDELEIDDTRRKVSVEGREVKLTPIEYKILRLLVQERGRVLSISQIYEAIWHMQAIGADNTIAVHIRHIREKIESNPKNPRYLKVVWGTGYKVG